MKQETGIISETSECKENISLVDSLYAVAVEDLEASRNLYEIGNYRHSVFFLQQSVEKATKSLSLHLNVITEEELKGKIGHYPPEIYKKFITQIMDGISDLITEAINDPDMRRQISSTELGINTFLIDVDRTKNNVNVYIDSFRGNYNLSNNELLDLLCQLKASNSQCKEFSATVDRYLSEEQFNKHLKNIKLIVNILLFIAPVNKKEKDEFKSSFNNLLDSLCPKREFYEYLIHAVISLVYSGLLLFYLSLITAPHAMRARYPESKDNFSPEIFYNGELPLVKKLDQIIFFTSRAIEEVGKFYSIIFYFPQISEDFSTIPNILKKKRNGDEIQNGR